MGNKHPQGYPQLMGDGSQWMGVGSQPSGDNSGDTLDTSQEILLELTF